MGDSLRKATRAKAPRVRTGCITCKKRHVKCDERKPFCRKCAAACLVCAGYDVAPTRKPRALGSRFRPREVPAQLLLAQTQESLALSPPRGLDYDPNDSQICADLFHHARTCAMEDLETSPSPTKFWYNYALPLSHSSDAVRHALCALGGAHRIFKLQHANPGSAVQPVHNASLQQYNSAIQCLNTFMDKATESDTVVILTCCVLFISLENLFGRYAESLRHLKAGSSLLTWLIYQRDKSNASMKIFEEYSETLCRLGDDVWGYIREMVAPDLNIYSTEHGSRHRDNLFSSVDNAEQALHDITKLFEADNSVIQRKIRAYAQYGYSQSQRRFMPATPSPHFHGISFDTLRARFHRWSAKFDIFCKNLDMAKTTQKDLLRTKVLAVDQALWTGWLNCNEWRDYKQEDLNNIIERAESLVQLDAFTRSPVFAFDGSLILCITMACVCSADSSTQWRCIRLLRSLRRREGIWDSQELADILEAMMAATSSGVISKTVLPWDVPHLARMIELLDLAGVHIPRGPLSLVK